jgi:hypothetical protein
MYRVDGFFPVTKMVATHTLGVFFPDDIVTIIMSYVFVSRQNDSVLSVHNWARCDDDNVKILRRSVPLVLRFGDLRRRTVFYPHRAILCYNNARSQRWRVKGMWNDGYYDAIEVYCTSVNSFQDGFWYSHDLV